MRYLLLSGFAASTLLAAVGCNNEGVVAGGGATSSPTPAGTSTPVPCQFYGVDDVSNLWRIDTGAVTATLIGATGQSQLTDLAITPSGEMVAISAAGAFVLDPASGASTPLTSLTWALGQNALGALPDGHLLVGGGGDGTLRDVDPATSQTAAVASFSGRVFSGDIAVAPGAAVAFGTLTDQVSNDHLVSFDLSAHTATDLGDLGYTEVFGIDYGCDGVLYGMIASQAPPLLVKINPASAQVTVLGPLSGPDTLWGAAGPTHP